MDDRLIKLYVQRGRLRERISAQRTQLAQDLAPLGTALQMLDRTRGVLQQVQRWLTARPAIVSMLAVAVLVWRPRAVLRSLRWGYSAWRTWQQLRESMHAR